MWVNVGGGEDTNKTWFKKEELYLGHYSNFASGKSLMHGLTSLVWAQKQSRAEPAEYDESYSEF